MEKGKIRLKNLKLMNASIKLRSKCMLLIFYAQSSGTFSFDSESSYSSYMSIANDEWSNIALKLLSIFDYISYEILGGEEPEIFIRLNDPQKVKNIVLGNTFYSNNYVNRAKQKHDRDVSVLLKFFNGLNTDKERSGGFSKPNHLYVKIPSDEIGLQPVDDKAVEKMTTTESEKQPSSSCKNGCAGVGNVAPSKVTEKYKSNKYHEVNYCYGEGESL